jgi:hypothetical protein
LRRQPSPSIEYEIGKQSSTRRVLTGTDWAPFFYIAVKKEDQPMDDRKKRAKCDLKEEDWLLEQREFCDSRYADGEMNRYCHAVVRRELERRKKECDK